MDIAALNGGIVEVLKLTAGIAARTEPAGTLLLLQRLHLPLQALLPRQRQRRPLEHVPARLLIVELTNPVQQDIVAVNGV